MIEVKDFRKKYKDFELDCTMEVKPGYVTGLIGRNGAGKTTTFKGVLGLINGDSGSVKMFGKDVRELSAEDKAKIGAVLSDSGFSRWLSIKKIDRILDATYKEHDSEKFMSLCKRFALPTDKITKDFSTGMMARLKLIVALTHKAEFVVLDEPTAGMDVIARDEILELLREYMEEDENRSILISSHISSDIESLCDDVYMIKDGKIVLHEETDTILSEYGLLKVTNEQYESLEKDYILGKVKTSYGYDCLTNQRDFYAENYKDIAVEKGNLDMVQSILIKEEK